MGNEKTGFVAKIISGGRLTIPEEYREIYSLSEGETVHVSLKSLDKKDEITNEDLIKMQVRKQISENVDYFNEKLNQLGFMSDKLHDRLFELDKKYEELQIQGMKTFNVDTLIYSDTEKIDKARKLLEKIAREDLRLAMYSVERFSLLAEVSREKTASFKILSNSIVNIMGVKYMSGDGWGKYKISMGTQLVRTFTKSNLVKEDGVTIAEILYHTDDILIIRQDTGEGTLQIELIGLELKPPGALAALETLEI